MSTVGRSDEMLEMYAAEDEQRLGAAPRVGPHPDDPGPVDPDRGKANGTTHSRKITLTRASQIEDDVPVWAWEYNGHGRIMVGTLALFGGRPGAGKSTAARWLAAELSRGTLPGVWSKKPQNIAYISTEESWKYTIKPGLRAAGADLDRIMRPEVSINGKQTRLLSHVDEAALTRELRDAGVTVVIVDPVMSTIDGKTDIYRNNETREVLEPWARIADNLDGICIGVCHLIKSPGGDVVAALSGSSAFGEVARSVFGFAKDNEAEGDQRVMSQAKNSAGREDLALLYTIEETLVLTDSQKSARVARFVILGESERTVGDILRDAGRGASGPATADVKRWLITYLSDGPRWSVDCYSAAQAAGFSEDQVKRAKKDLGITSKKIGSNWYTATPEQVSSGQTPNQERSDIEQERTPAHTHEDAHPCALALFAGGDGDDTDETARKRARVQEGGSTDVTLLPIADPDLGRGTEAQATCRDCGQPLGASTGKCMTCILEKATKTVSEAI